MTDAELDAVEAHVRSEQAPCPRCFEVASQLAREADALVAEVRRLRKLVADEHGRLAQEMGT